MVVNYKKDWKILNSVECTGDAPGPAYYIGSDGTTKSFEQLTKELQEAIKKEQNLPLPEEMADCKRAYIKLSKECMNRECSEKELKKTLRKIKDKESKVNYERWWRHSEEYLQLEAEMWQHNTVKELKFIPTNHPKTKDGITKALGYYIAKVLRTKSKGEKGEPIPFHVRVCTDWVENNFLPEYIAICQKLGYDVSKKHIVNRNGKATKTKGFIAVPPKWHGILDEQIYQIRWVPRLQQWQGISHVLDPNTKSGTRQKHSNLTDEWVRNNFLPEFVNMAQHSGETGNSGFTVIPPGDSINHDDTIVYDETAPIIQYQQKADEKTCLFSAAASALSYLNMPHLSIKLYNESQKKENWLRPVHIFREIMITEQKENGGLHIIGAKKTFNPVTDAHKYWLCVLVLRGEDGKGDHAIAITDGWIFDSNFMKALQLTSDNLDLCCSSDTHKSKFKCIPIGYLFERNIKKRKSETISK